MTAARAKAKQILRELHIEDPALLKHLVEICIERGAYVRQAKLDGAEARLTVDGKRGIITVPPANGYAARTRFSIAHELGHFELHRQVRATLNCDGGALGEWFGREDAKGRESEANDFASELLMPEQFIAPEIKVSTPGLGVIQALAHRYETSLFATAKRYIGLTARPCIAVFFKKDRILYSWKAAFFEEMNLSLKTKLDPGSFAYRAARGRKTPRIMQGVPLSTWFRVPAALARAEIQEEAKYFPKLDIGVSLLWIRDRELIEKFQ